MTLRERLLQGKVGLGRFVPLQGTMRAIRDHADLENLRAQGVGFIINIRDNESKIHRVNCDAVQVMHTATYPKVFGETAAEVIDWVKTDVDKVAWANCGVCGGAR
jgi:hypothetical protein